MRKIAFTLIFVAGCGHDSGNPTSAGSAAAPTMPDARGAVTPKTSTCKISYQRVWSKLVSDGPLDGMGYHDVSYFLALDQSPGTTRLLWDYMSKFCAPCSAEIEPHLGEATLFPKDMALPLRIVDCLYFVDANGKQWHSPLEDKLEVELIRDAALQGPPPGPLPTWPPFQPPVEVQWRPLTCSKFATPDAALLRQFSQLDGLQNRLRKACRTGHLVEVKLAKALVRACGSYAGIGRFLGECKDGDLLRAPWIGCYKFYLARPDRVTGDHCELQFHPY